MDFQRNPHITEKEIQEKLASGDVIFMDEETYMFVIYVSANNLQRQYRAEMEAQMEYTLEYILLCVPAAINDEEGVMLLFKPSPATLTDENVQAVIEDYSERKHEINEQFEQDFGLNSDEEEIIIEEPEADEDSDSDSDDIWI